MAFREAASWWNGGLEAAIAVSTRSRIVRNIAGMPFPSRLNADDREAVVSIAGEAIEKSGMFGPTGVRCSVASVSPIERRILVERTLLRSSAGEADVHLWVSADETIAVAVNDDDHLRIGATTAGADAAFAYQRTLEHERLLETTIPFSFDPTHGFHATSASDVGTGLRLSVMVHVPLLIWEQKAALEKLLTAIVRSGGVISGMRGHKSRSIGDIIEISNQSTLGVSEREIVDNARTFIRKIIRAETKAREDALKKDRALIEDRVWRSLATLRAARSITYLETTAFLSWIRVGAHMGIISVPMALITMALFTTQKAHLCREHAALVPKAGRDIIRADRMRALFAPYGG
ncbi:MAG: hypothetical protein AABZ39_10715 [Spirochaetota bacterium]